MARGLDLNTGQSRYGVLKVTRLVASLDSSAVIPVGRHLFPFRTEKLSLPGPMVLGGQPPGRVGRRRFAYEKGPRERPFFMPPRRRTRGPARWDRARAAGAPAPRWGGA